MQNRFGKAVDMITGNYARLIVTKLANPTPTIYINQRTLARFRRDLNC